MGHPARQSIINRVAARFGGAPDQSAPERTRACTDTWRAVSMGLLAGTAVLSVATGIEMTGQALGVRDDRKFAETSAPLTAGERALVQGVFGPDFSTDGITKYFHREMPPHQRPRRQDDPSTLAYVLTGNDRDIHFISRDSHARDYSRVPDQGQRVSTFMHEMTHIWQHRQGMTEDCDVYDYQLTDRSRFGDFCNEQQAAIIGEYTRVFLQPDSLLGQTKGLMPQMNYSPAGNNLIRVVEEQFPHARTSRMAMQSRFNAAGMCVQARARAYLSTQQLNTFSLRNVWADCASRYVTTLNGQHLDALAAAPMLAATPPQPSVTAQIRLWWANTL